jgi:hypothetical protein
MTQMPPLRFLSRRGRFLQSESLVGAESAEVVRLRAESQKDGFQALVDEIQAQVDLNEVVDDDNDSDDDDDEEFDVFGRIRPIADDN